VLKKANDCLLILTTKNLQSVINQYLALAYMYCSWSFTR